MRKLENSGNFVERRGKPGKFRKVVKTWKFREKIGKSREIGEIQKS